MTDFKWSEGVIAAALARNTFAGHLLCLPNCTWTGAEVDLLVVHKSLRVIDVEVKISRADLKADAAKDKWWHRPDWAQVSAAFRAGLPTPQGTPRQWPPRTWKHYYALPAELWRDDMRALVQPISGVLLVKRVAQRGYADVMRVQCVKPAKPRRDAQTLGADDVFTLARLTSLRTWDAYKNAERVRRDHADMLRAARGDQQCQE